MFGHSRAQWPACPHLKQLLLATKRDGSAWPPPPSVFWNCLPLPGKKALKPVRSLPGGTNLPAAPDEEEKEEEEREEKEGEEEEGEQGGREGVEEIG